jgi:endonuclease YncB( thermonuclease family)
MDTKMIQTQQRKRINLYNLTLLLLFSVSCSLLPPPTIAENGVLAPNAPQLPNASSETGLVDRVIDGDTIDVLIDGQTFRVRYIGINTPERDETCFTAATEANAAYVEGQTVRLVKDSSETDRFGRLLRYVYVGEVLVNAELVAGGWAESRRYRPDDKLYDYLEGLEGTAVTQQLGCHPSGVFNP